MISPPRLAPGSGGRMQTLSVNPFFCEYCTEWNVPFLVGINRMPTGSESQMNRCWSSIERASLTW